jgi:hypothetical protein
MSWLGGTSTVRDHFGRRAGLTLCLATALFSWLGVIAAGGTARAAETVSIGGSKAVLLKPAAPVASVILMPGGDGRIEAGPGGKISRLAGNSLVRNRAAFAAKGLAVLVVDANVNLGEAVKYMANIKKPVTVIGTSRGTLRAAKGIARGARPDALVLTSGFLTNASGSHDNVANILGSPGKLPNTLVIHHRNDGCRVTLPAGVAPFIKWASGKARVVWLSGGGTQGNPCKGKSHHGFLGLDAQMVAVAAKFR